MLAVNARANESTAPMGPTRVTGLAAAAYLMHLLCLDGAGGGFDVDRLSGDAVAAEHGAVRARVLCSVCWRTS